MDLVDYFSSSFLLIVAASFTIGAFVWRGIIWFGLLAALFWIMYGFTCINVITEVYTYQRTLALVWFVIGIGMLFSPLWINRKQKSMGEEIKELDDIDDFNQGINEIKNTQRKYRALGLRKKKPREPMSGY